MEEIILPKNRYYRKYLKLNKFHKKVLTKEIKSTRTKRGYVKISFSSDKDKIDFMYLLLCHKLTLGIFVYETMKLLFKNDDRAWDFLRYIMKERDLIKNNSLAAKNITEKQELEQLFEQQFQLWTKVEREHLEQLLQTTDFNDNFELSKFALEELTQEKFKKRLPESVDKLDITNKDESEFTNEDKFGSKVVRIE